MRIAHISDVHLGYRAYSRVDRHGRNQRESDVLLAFKRVLKQALDNEPDLILITGDLFHTVRPSNTSLLGAYTYFSEAQGRREGAPMLVIAGNHETPRTIESGCILEILKHIPGVTVVYNTIQAVVIESLGLHALCIPSRGVPEIEKHMLEPDPKAKVNLLLLHGILEGTAPFALERPIERKRIVREEWDYIALGDYHLHQQVAPNAYYAGATEFTSTNIWEEAGKEKGFILYDTEVRTAQFIPIRTRRVIDLLPIDAQDLTIQELNKAIESRANSEGFDGAIVRQRVYNLLPDQRSGIDGDLIRELRTRALHYQLDLRAPRAGGRPSLGTGHEDEETGETRLTLQDEWRQFAGQYTISPDIRRNEMIELGIHYLDRVGAEVEST